MSEHVRVFAIAVAFGLAAYAVILALIWLSRRIGVLEWLGR